ncbi:hypothetical protein [Lapidilactobacillus luobeiensis]|uniref:hypothetical protein n=1 Tax=Lapidilactobacillus luobeiensis TaxID=2950371 RepID=UPI0021C4948C|nr:hypothetical protein [Lapidilactobacillus luobeiensis]
MTVTYKYADDLAPLSTEAAWQADREESRVVLPTGLEPLTLAWADAPAAEILGAIIEELCPQASLVAATELAAQALQTTWGKKAPLALTPARGSLGTRFSELGAGPTMTAADWSTALVQDLAKSETPLSLVAHDPALLIALAEKLLPGNHLTGFADLSRLAPLVQKQFLATALLDDVAPLSVDQTEDLVTLAGWQQERAHLQETVKAEQRYYVPVDGGQLAVILPQILDYFLIAQQAPDQDLTIVTATTDFSNIIAARYAQLLGAPIKRLFVTLTDDHLLAQYQQGEQAALPWATLKNLLRLAASFDGQARDLTATWAQLSATWQDWLQIEVVAEPAILREIRRGQTQDQLTLGVTAAQASAFVQAHQLKNAIVLSLADPFQTPEAILRGITNRQDGKTDFEAVQILRQIVDLKVPRVLTHLKAKTLPTLPQVPAEEIVTQLSENL